MRTIELEVSGHPVQQGSMRSPAAGVVMHNKGRELDTWRLTVGVMMRQQYKGAPHDGPVAVNAAFCYPPRKSKKKDDGRSKTTAPDLDKLLRAIFDAGTGVLWRDDSLIASVRAIKMYDSEFYGVRLRVVLEDEDKTLKAPEVHVRLEAGE